MLLYQLFMLQIRLLPAAHDAVAMNRLYLTQTEAQRAIAKHINAYPLWAAGEVRDDRWEALVAKFSSRYETDISPAARQWRKKRHQCCAHLVGAALPNDTIRWVLLVTGSGSGAVKDHEHLRDAHADRLVWGDYLLVRTTRASVFGGGTHWTWSMTPQIERSEANYLTKLAAAAATGKQPDRLTAFTDALLRRPLHAGVRGQIAKMLRRAQKVWKKHSRGASWPGPDPRSLPHVGRYRSGAASSPTASD